MAYGRLYGGSPSFLPSVMGTVLVSHTYSNCPSSFISGLISWLVYWHSRSDNHTKCEERRSNNPFCLIFPNELRSLWKFDDRATTFELPLRSAHRSMCANPIVMFTIGHVLVHYCMACKGGHNDSDTNVNFTFAHSEISLPSCTCRSTPVYFQCFH